MKASNNEESSVATHDAVTRADVVIVGGGFTGLCAAAALSDGRRRVLVLEARTGRDPRFRGELMHPPGVRELERLGLLRAMRARGGNDVHGFAVAAEDGRFVRLDYETVERGGAGDGYAMDHPLMVEALRDEVSRRPGVELRLGARVADVLRESGRIVGVRMADGTEARAPLTLVCEGRLSKLRGLLGLEGRSDLLSYSVAVLAEGAELPVPGRGHVVLGAPGPLLAYPIGGAVRFCIDVPTETDKGREAIAARLRREYGPLLPAPLRDALEHGLASDGFELCATQQVRTHRCVVPGAALLGDAGGCSHPLTAAGMTTSLHDIRTFADLLDANRFEPLDTVLGEYERQRYRYVRARELLTERLYEVFLGDRPGHRALRDGVLRYWESSPRARVASMALLSGQRTDVGAFVQELGFVFANALVETAAREDRSGAARSVPQRVRLLGSMVRATVDTARGAARTVAGELQRNARHVPVELLDRGPGARHGAHSAGAQ